MEKCPKCNSELYEKERRENESGIFVSIRCYGCNFFDYRKLEVN